MSDLMINLSLKYDGARPLRHLKAIVASLNLSYPRFIWFTLVFLRFERSLFIAYGIKDM